MSRGNWNRIKHSKFFYVQIYRKLITIIIASQAINVILFTGIAYFYTHQPERTYYATSGIAQPILLSALDKPNSLSEALLPPDPINEEGNKVVPE